jgi:succinyl-diaminopimelate desuccinylase
MTVNRKRLITLTQKLISINSENPPGDESRIARFVRDYLLRFGMSSRIYEFKPRRSNVIARLKGKDSQRSLLITPHLDTVPAGRSWSRSPFAGKILKGRIYGLGSTDCKGNLACALEAITGLVEEGISLDYDLIFAATADEESGSDLGLVPLLNRGLLKTDAALILDADDFEIIVTQKGLLHLKVKVKGIRAHGAYPDKGVNAIDKAMESIRQLKAQKFSYKKNKYLKPPTMNVGTIKGGDKVNIVADWCEYELDIRFMPGTDGKELLSRVKRIVSGSASGGQVEVEGIQAPYDISETHPLVASLKSAIRQAGIRPVVEGSEGATVITFFQDHGIPAVATGFGSGGTAHAADEFVKIKNLCKGVEVLRKLFKNIKLTEERKG